MSEHTAREQLMLELINHARLDPAAEAKRLGISLNDGLASGTIDATSKAPLAANFFLVDAARDHSRWMLDTGIFSHTGYDNTTPAQRMYDAGYDFYNPWDAGENIIRRSIAEGSDSGYTTAVYNQHKSLFLSAGHRATMLSDYFVEMGIGQTRGNFNGTYSSMITQNFAASGTAKFVTGVIYNDTDGDNFYSVGEGVAGLDIRAGIINTESLAHGGYQIPLTSGVHQVRLGTAVVDATMLNENAKIDLVDGVRVDSSVSLTLVSGIREALLLGRDNLSLTGSSASDLLTGNKGNNAISGGAGNDKLYGASGNDTLRGDIGDDRLYGQNGDDTLHGNDGRDYLSGGAGNDKLYGGAGADTLLGGAGDDTLNGGESADKLTGGAGADRLTGGTGADTFIFTALSDSTVDVAGRDRITDFSRSQVDRIDVSAIDASTRVGGNQAFKFIGDNSFSGAGGELRYVKNATITYVYADVDGDRRSDFVIRLDTAQDLGASDFIL